ncbi:MAG: hypothetical protein K0U60_05290 [Actinomycetia bacterium]|nr:hypothetical protein [Actinomycetes bacterium]MCH9802105.1 hypothetical protein [Actinomycetes bacterium]
MTPKQPQKILGGFSRALLQQRLRGTTVVPVPSPDWARQDSGPQPPHYNWLIRADYQLPNERFARYLDVPEHNLIDLVEQAALPLTRDQVVVVRPIGSISYARDHNGLDWDLVRDLDIWVYLSHRSLAGRHWRQLHRELQDRCYRTMKQHGLWVQQSSDTGNTFLKSETGRPRMVEVKVADVAWLTAGLRHAHRRRSHLFHTPRAAHFDSPRLEWAGYLPYENYFPSAAGEQTFAAAVGSLTIAQTNYGLLHAFGENLAEAYRNLAPARTVRAIAQRRWFFRTGRKALKKELMLATLLGDETRHSEAVRGLHAMTTGIPMVDSRTGRREFLAARASAVQRLRLLDYPQLRRDVEAAVARSLDVERASETVNSTAG